MLATSANLAIVDRPALGKPFRITYELRPGYLCVHVWSDTISYQIARRYWNEIVVMLARYPTKRILVDKNIAAELPVAEAFRIASEVAAGFKNMRLALYDRHAAQSDMEFSDLVAANGGLNTRSFTDLAAAEKWLLTDA